MSKEKELKETFERDSGLKSDLILDKVLADFINPKKTGRNLDPASTTDSDKLEPMSIATIKGRVATRIKQFDWEWDNVFAWIVTVLLCSATFGLILYALVGSLFLVVKNFWEHPEVNWWPLLTALLTVTVVVGVFRAHYRKHRIKVNWELGNVLGMLGGIIFLTAFGLFVPEMSRVVFDVLKNIWRSLLDPEEWPMNAVGIGVVVFLFLTMWLLYYAEWGKSESPNHFADFLLRHSHKVFVAIEVIAPVVFRTLAVALVAFFAFFVPYILWRERSELLTSPPWPQLAFLAVFFGVLGLLHWVTRERR